MILSKHALKGHGNKLVKEFLSTLESASAFVRALFLFWAQLDLTDVEAYKFL